MKKLSGFFFGSSDNLRQEYTAQKVKFSVSVIFSKCDQIRSSLQIWSYSLRTSLMEVNPFHVNVLFIYPLKTPENHAENYRPEKKLSKVLHNLREIFFV